MSSKVGWAGQEAEVVSPMWLESVYCALTLGAFAMLWREENFGEMRDQVFSIWLKKHEDKAELGTLAGGAENVDFLLKHVDGA